MSGSLDDRNRPQIRTPRYSPTSASTGSKEGSVLNV
jgi:hypothetical protein